MRLISLALLVAGVILLILGFNASESVASELKEAVTGNPTDRSIWFFVGGAVLAVVGAASLLLRAPKSS